MIMRLMPNGTVAMATGGAPRVSPAVTLADPSVTTTGYQVSGMDTGMSTGTWLLVGAGALALFLCMKR